MLASLASRGGGGASRGSGARRRVGSAARAKFELKSWPAKAWPGVAHAAAVAAAARGAAAAPAQWPAETPPAEAPRAWVPPAAVWRAARMATTEREFANPFRRGAVERVLVTSDAAAAAAWAAAHAPPGAVVGFAAEALGRARHGAPGAPPAVLQLAGLRGRTLVLQLPRPRAGRPIRLPEALLRALGDASVIKAGVGVRQKLESLCDAGHLGADAAVGGAAAETAAALAAGGGRGWVRQGTPGARWQRRAAFAGAVDLGLVGRRFFDEVFDAQPMAPRRLADACYGLAPDRSEDDRFDSAPAAVLDRRSKHTRDSDWAAAELTPHQVEYAALAAVAGREMHGDLALRGAFSRGEVDRVEGEMHRLCRQATKSGVRKALYLAFESDAFLETFAALEQRCFFRGFKKTCLPTTRLFAFTDARGWTIHYTLDAQHALNEKFQAPTGWTVTYGVDVRDMPASDETNKPWTEEALEATLDAQANEAFAACHVNDVQVACARASSPGRAIVLVVERAVARFEAADMLDDVFDDERNDAINDARRRL
ncbi:hypothetical protein M885DRAFT_510941 [Pelagophyceae sp. CCMP2097]|nr:hypothetical protein M885DRAFT_510941 [Pelagophyceae sp. CCMP2097]